MIEQKIFMVPSGSKESYVMNFPKDVQDMVLDLCEHFSGKVGYDVDFPVCVCTCIEAVYCLVQSGEFYELFEFNPESADSDFTEDGVDDGD